MASRMDRYRGSATNAGRSKKNQSLYDEIKNLDTYSNIEGVASIEHANEIDINAVKKLLRNRENYKKQRQAGLFDEQNSKEVIEKEETKPVIEEKNYDINAILNKIKNEKQLQNEDNLPRRLNDEQFEFLKKLNEKNVEQNVEQNELEKLENEPKDVVQTIKMSKKALEDTDSDLLDDLKSDTMVGEAASIKSIIEEEKNKTKVLEDTSTMQLDKSFYTSSFGFTKSDFEELKDMNKKIKKSNKFIIILLVLLILGGLAVGAYFMFLKK